MTGTYAIKDPWQQLAAGCGQVGPGLVKWLAAMSGHAHQRSRRATPPWLGAWGGEPPMPFGPPWGGGGRGWRGPKARPGDVRAAILGLLAEEPRNGYQLIQTIAERSHGAWKPSPGSVYPTLQQLEDEGLVEADGPQGRRTFSLTDLGGRYVIENADEIAAPWQAAGQWGATNEALRPLIGQVAAAVWQVMSTGTPDQQERSREALLELRRRLYTILAEDDAERGRS